MPDFEIRPGRPEDAREVAELFAAIAEERDGIATEPPVDLEARTSQFAASAERTIVAHAGGEIVGFLFLIAPRLGVTELAMAVAQPWRGRGVGSTLLAAAIEKARDEEGVHKIALEVFPHNAAAIALYRRFGFVEEGRRVKHYRRASGELWDSIMMGLLL